MTPAEIRERIEECRKLMDAGARIKTQEGMLDILEAMLNQQPAYFALPLPTLPTFPNPQQIIRQALADRGVRIPEPDEELPDCLEAHELVMKYIRARRDISNESDAELDVVLDGMRDYYDRHKSEGMR
jgi:hypothetical protein